MELKELNWLCKHMKNVRSSQTYISMNFCSELSKEQVFHVSLKKKNYKYMTWISKNVYIKEERKKVIFKKLLTYSFVIMFGQKTTHPLGPKYAKILNMAEFSKSERYTAFWICQNMSWKSSNIR